jgi:hypothetical protein
VYGLARLTNRVEGAHADRFRPVGRDGFLPGFDVLEAAADADLRAVEARFGRFYVYTLRDTRTGRPFYVGKGTGRRMFAHFRDAAGASPVDPAGHLPALRQLMREGCVPSDVCRVEARVADEQQAFALEALMLKFVHGLPGVDNRVAGHHGEMFRAKGDWAIRRGFDLPYVCDPGAASDRADKRDGMIGEGLAVPLLAVAAEFPDLRFDPPRVLDSADLGVEADVVPPAGGAGVRLKVFIRRRRLQVELRPRRKAHRDWVREHFTRLGAYPLRRRDDVFFPDAWRGPGNMTDDLAEVARRVRLLREIVDATDPKSLSAEARSLLPSRVTGSP